MIIAHDLGTTGNKASLHHPDGRLVEAATSSYPTHYDRGGVAEQDPERWWTAVVEATRELLRTSGTAADAVTAIAMSGQMMGAVLLDDAYRPVRPALIWADSRSTAEADELNRRLDPWDTYRRLGNRLNPTYTLTKLMWVARHEPDVFARTRHVCLAKDLVVHRLTGELLTDRSDASSTNAWEQSSGRWAEDLIAAAGLDPALFPQVVEATTVVGPLTAEAAAALGLPRSVQVVLGGGDGPVAAVGAGVTSPQSGAYAYLGSSSWVSLSAPAPVHDPERRTMTFDHVVPGQYAATATMVAGGASLEWAGEVFEPAGDADRFERLLAGTDEVEAAADGLFYLPHLLGERSPYWDPRASGGFLGVQRHHTRAHLVRAMLEGVAFNLRTCIEAFRSSGASVARVDAIGGGAMSDLWLRVMSDVWGVPVRRRSIVEEGNSLGAAVTAAVALGYVPDFTVASGLSEVTAEFHPESGRAADYGRRHAIFLEGYRALAGWSRSRHGGARTG